MVHPLSPVLLIDFLKVNLRYICTNILLPCHRGRGLRGQTKTKYYLGPTAHEKDLQCGQFKSIFLPEMSPISISLQEMSPDYRLRMTKDLGGGLSGKWSVFLPEMSPEDQQRMTKDLGGGEALLANLDLYSYQKCLLSTNCA